MRRHCLIATGLVCFALCQMQFAPAAYYVTYLGVADPTDDVGSAACAVNASGQVAGYSTGSGGQANAFLWSAGGGFTSWGSGEAHGINSAGEVVGFINGNTDAFSWTSGGGVTILAKKAIGSTAAAYGVNDAGRIVGVSNSRAVRWANSTATPTNLLGFDEDSLGLGAYATNTSGQMAGYSAILGTNRAALWQAGGGVATNLGVLTSGSSSLAYGLNDAGQVVGYSTINGQTICHAVLFHPGTLNPTDLGTLQGSGNSYARGINAGGQVVGDSTTSDPVVPSHAFVWTDGAGMVDLNARVDTGGAWTIEKANAINGSGQIVGVASRVIGGGIDHREAFLLTPAILGDANLDKAIDGTDLNIVLSNYNQSVTQGIAGWKMGDFNYDGTVDGADLNAVLSNYNQHLGLGAAVPEPSTLLLAAAGLLGLLACPSRKRKGGERIDNL
jgi:probable HAF family extracellular repeat protein